MFPPERILFPVDFSKRCDAVAPMVETYVGRFQAELIVLHAVPPVDSAYGVPLVDAVTPARVRISGYLTGEFEHFDVQRVVTPGDPALTIIDYAENNGMDLIMMPTHGYGPFRRFVIGSVTAKVLHDAACPVWTSVHTEETPPLESIQFRHIVAAVDFGPQTPCVLKWAASFAKETGAGLTLVHAVPTAQDIPGFYCEQCFKQEMLREARERAVRTLNDAGIHNGHISVAADEVVRAISETARQLQADLVVIGRGPTSGLGRLRTQAYQIIRQSPCPVVSV